MVNYKLATVELEIPKKHFIQWTKMIGLHLKHSKKSAMVKEILKEDSK